MAGALMKWAGAGISALSDSVVYMDGSLLSIAGLALAEVAERRAGLDMGFQGLAAEDAVAEAVCQVDKEREAAMFLEDAVGQGDMSGDVGMVAVGIEDLGRGEAGGAVDAGDDLRRDLVAEAEQPFH